MLKEPTIYICRRDQDDNSHGVSAFWQLVEGTYWYPTEEIEGNERLVATVTLDLPVFEAGRPHFETHGTIFCEFDDKLFQTPTPPVRLTAQNTIDGSCAIDLSDEEARFSILALKVCLVVGMCMYWGVVAFVVYSEFLSFNIFSSLFCNNQEYLDIIAIKVLETLSLAIFKGY